MNSSAAPQQILAGCWTEVKWGKVERCVCECLCVSMVVLAFSAQGPNAFRELADTLWAVWAAASLCQASPLFLLLPCTPPPPPPPAPFTVCLSLQSLREWGIGEYAECLRNISLASMFPVSKFGVIGASLDTRSVGLTRAYALALSLDKHD